MRDVSSAFVSRTRGMDAEHDRCWRRAVGVAAVAVVASVLVPRAYVSAQTSTRDTSRVADTIPVRPSIDSLAARLERTEAALALLRQQMSTESGTSVRTRSRLQLDLWARILMNGFMSRGALNSADVPTFAAPAVNPALTPRAVGLSLRQTRIGLSLFVDSVAGATFDGDFDADFFAGGQAGPTEEYQFPQPRLRTAKFTLRWPRTELLVGGETPLISDMSPVTVASVGVPGFAEAGNLWNWLPQIRVSREMATTALGQTPLHWAVQGAVLHPFAGESLEPATDGVDAGVRSGRPYLEARAHARWGTDATPTGAGPGDAGGDIGIGVHRGWIRSPDNSLVTSSAVSVDARIGLPREFELRGEAYRGTALAGLGGGGIDQNFGSTPSATSTTTFGVPLRDTGGWTQLNWKAHPAFITGVGCGIDAPSLDDEPLRRRNVVCAEHVLWHPAQPLLFGVELRQLRTTYATGVLRGTHLNLSFGFEL